MVPFATTSTNKFYRSTDAGENWEFMSDVDEFGVVIQASNNPNRVYSGWLSIYESNNGGASWDKLSHWYSGTGVPAVHADQRKVFKNPLQPHLVYFCNDGGVYTYNMDTENFTDYSDGLIIMQYYKVASAQDNPFVIIGGTQDNGGRRRDANGQWRATNGGDAMEVALDPNDNEILYTTYIYGQMYRSMDGWGSDTYNCISCNIPGMEDDATGSWVTPYQLDPVDPQIIIAGYESIWLSSNRGDSWTSISQPLNFGTDMDVIEVYHRDNDWVIYAASESKLYRGEYNGSSWAWVSVSDPVSQDILAIEVDSLDADNVYITYGGYIDGSRVYQSGNAGNNWNNISVNLPNVPITAIKQYKAADNAILVGTDVGIFITDDTFSGWEPYGTNLPSTLVTDIDFQYNIKKIRIATYGRGIFEAATPDSCNDYDNDGICNSQDICPDGNDLVDVDGDGIPNACDPCNNLLVGESCNDGDPCTVNEIWDEECNCLGEFQDEDADGICDNDDPCNNNLEGEACDDGDDCTIQDALNVNCECVGILIDSDFDGICDKIDLYPGTFELFPTPVKDVLSVYIQFSDQPTRLAIFDINGRAKYENSSVRNRDHRIDIQVGNFPAGIYVITVEQGTSCVSKKFIVHR